MRSIKGVSSCIQEKHHFMGYNSSVGGGIHENMCMLQRWQDAVCYPIEFSTLLVALCSCSSSARCCTALPVWRVSHVNA